MSWIAIRALLSRLNLGRTLLVLAVAGFVGMALAWRVELGIERRHTAKLEMRVNELRAELDRITDERNRQKETTGDNIAKAEGGMKQAQGWREKVEAIPEKGDCSTPSEIMHGGL